LLFPIDWAEPFGLVMIEAMACGTPVVAFRRGSVPEVMVDGATGFVVNDVPWAVEAVGQVSGLSRRVCRQVFVERFGAPRMARDYLEVYRKLVGGEEQPGLRGGKPSDGRGPADPIRRHRGLLGPIGGLPPAWAS
jgi:glycosyltransferase involved in cell wall biosynthesis